MKTIDQLPLGNAASSNNSDSVPFFSTSAPSSSNTQKMALSDVPNIPSLVKKYATKHFPLPHQETSAGSTTLSPVAPGGFGVNSPIIALVFTSQAGLGSNTEAYFSGFRVPDDYVSGTQIFLKVPALAFSAGTANPGDTVFLQGKFSAFRPGATSGPFSSRTSANALYTIPVSNPTIGFFTLIDVTDATGLGLQAGDYVSVQLFRKTTETSAADLHVAFGGIEVYYGV